MHILTLTTLFPNSLQPVHGIFVYNRMEAFTRIHGHQWSVVAPVPWFPRLPWRTSETYDTFARVPNSESVHGQRTSHPRYLVTPKLGMRWYGAWMAKGVRATVKAIHAKNPIDAIDGHYIYPDGTAAIDIGRELGVPVVISARGTDLNLFPKLPPIRPLIRRNLEAAAAVICVSPDLGRIAKEHGASAGKLHVIGNGVDTKRFHPLDQAESRAKLGLPHGMKIILCVGHLIAMKGFDLALHAAARQSRKDLFVVLAGEGSEKGRLEKLAGELGIADRVKFVGNVANPELAPWYASADFFFLGSSREGWPNVICEAQAMGLPILGSRIPILEELVTAGMGELAERNPEAMAKALEKALATAYDRDRILGVGQGRSWDQVAGMLQGIFSGLGRAR